MVFPNFFGMKKKGVDAPNSYAQASGAVWERIVERGLESGLFQLVDEEDVFKSTLFSSIGYRRHGQMLNIFCVSKKYKGQYVSICCLPYRSLNPAVRAGDIEQVLSHLVRQDPVLREYVRKGEARAPWFEELVAGTQFEKRLLYRTKEGDHINVSEAKAYMAEVRRASRDAREHCKRRLYGLDSFVTTGAGSKGRSSSRRLNPVFRSGAPTLLLCRMYSGFYHIRSEWNPADDPTRGRTVRDAQPAPKWACEADVDTARAALEAAHPALRARRGAPRGLFPVATPEALIQTTEEHGPSPVETDGEAANPGPGSSTSGSSASSDSSEPRQRARTRAGRARARAAQPSVRERSLSKADESMRGRVEGLQGLVGRDTQKHARSDNAGRRGVHGGEARRIRWKRVSRWRDEKRVRRGDKRRRLLAARLAPGFDAGVGRRFGVGAS